MKKDFLKYGNLVAFIAVIVFNILATMGMIGGVSTRDVSYIYQSLLTPADYAFSIWSVIYVLLAITVYRQMRNDQITEKLNVWFLISCILNVGWILAWQFRRTAFSFILIFALLIDLIMLMRSVKESDTLSEMAIGLYTGWINVAMLANLGSMFSKFNWNIPGLSPMALAVVGLTIGILWIGMFLITYSNIYYGVGAIWGYLAIAFASDVTAVTIMAIVGTVIFAGSSIWVISRKKCVDEIKNC